MIDLAIITLVLLAQLVWAAWHFWWGHNHGHRLGYCRGRRDGRQEMWDAFYRQRPNMVTPEEEAESDRGAPEPAIPIETCRWCVDCDASACGCRTCHPRD